ncbi:hypothetical protein YOLOSWAG_252 [Erwinia phage vB_EamM_Yoloswag]|uniref:Uncharacterized protein n=1 Tax=Erwinia phage vB_EamM_Yoloswag TaxID=1958956 RepID=A0A1S6L3H8_9CAUD|nr:hypothetical protein HOR66_gp252 [Erwinia phage vB_EamM_Yoloswag]AQT28726.1 hypothetical protein YOLOSWAG_252 [Erwinia phage vB_EamM_Yoloswag]
MRDSTLVLLVNESELTQPLLHRTSLANAFSFNRLRLLVTQGSGVNNPSYAVDVIAVQKLTVTEVSADKTCIMIDMNFELAATLHSVVSVDEYNRAKTTRSNIRAWTARWQQGDIVTGFGQVTEIPYEARPDVIRSQLSKFTTEQLRAELSLRDMEISQ